jgi:hypothetical protein
MTISLIFTGFASFLLVLIPLRTAVIHPRLSRGSFAVATLTVEQHLRWLRYEGEDAAGKVEAEAAGQAKFAL